MSLLKPHNDMINTIKVKVCHGSVGIISGDNVLETIATIIDWVVIIGFIVMVIGLVAIIVKSVINLINKR